MCKMKNNNVAKHMHKCNKSVVFTDRKKSSKLGYLKHKRNFKVM